MCMMGFEELRAIENEAERVNETYHIFHEDSRLKTKAARVEFINTVKYIEKYLKPGDKILDIGSVMNNISSAIKANAITPSFLHTRFASAIACFLS